MRIELSHDALAAKIFEKVSADEKNLRKVEKFLRDRYAFYLSRGALLTRDELDYVLPHILQLDIGPPERAFVKKSQQRVRRKRNAFIATLAAVFIGLITTILIVNGYRIDANKNRLLAEENARKFEKANITIKKQKDDVSRALAKAEADRRRAQASDSVAQVNEALAHSKAHEARVQADSAQAAKLRADAARLKAEIATADAKKQFRRADSLRVLFRNKSLAAYLLTASSLASKSLQIEDPEIKALLAQQAFRLHSQFVPLTGRNRRSDHYNAVIYDGLYYSLKALEGSEMQTLYSHNKAVRSLAFSGDGRWLYSSGGDGKVLKWDFASREASYIEPEEFRETEIRRSMSAGTGSRYLAVANNSGGVELFDIRDVRGVQKAGKTFKNSRGARVYDLAFVPNQDRFVTSVSDQTIRVYNIYPTRGGEDIAVSQDTIDAVADRFKALAVSDDGNWVAGASQHGDIRVWEIGDPANPGSVHSPIFQFSDSGTSFLSVTFSHDKSLLCAGDDKGRLWIWERDENAAKKRMPVFSRRQRSLVGHRSGISEVIFSAGDSLIATASYDRNVLIRWLERDKGGRLIITDDPPITCSDANSYARSLAFSPDSRYVVAGYEDGSIKKWPTQMAFLASRLCPHLDRNLTAEEWSQYVGDDEDTQYEDFICADNPNPCDPNCIPLPAKKED